MKTKNYLSIVSTTLLLAACGSGGSSVHVHSLEHHAKKDATCLETGTVEYWKCSSCEKAFSDEQATKEIIEYTIPAKGHTLTHVASKEATCTENGVMEHWNCSACGKDFLDGSGTTVIDKVDIPSKGHKLVHHAAVSETCVEDGNIEYWSCSSCQSLFSDSEGKSPVTNVTLPKKGHKLTHHDAADATCSEEGNLEYWSCENCHLNYGDAEGNNRLDDVVLPKSGHNMIHHEAVSAGCVKAGNVEYWHCSTCDKNYSDAQGTSVVENVTIDATGHNVVHVEAQSASCTQQGRIEHYHCENCSENFSDAEAKNKIENVVIDPLHHDPVLHAASNPTKTEKGQSTSYYTCNHEAGVYYSDEACSQEISKSTVDGYALPSFDELDQILGDADGNLPYQEAAIASAKEAYDAYPASAKTAYDADSGKISGASANYANNFTLALDASDNWWNILGNSLPTDGMTSNWETSNASSERGAVISLLVKTKSSATGFRTSFFNKSNSSSLGLMYIKAPYATQFTIEDAWQNNKVTYTFETGWNEVMFTAAQWAGFKQTGGVRFYASSALEASSDPWLFSNMWGLTPSGDVSYRLATIEGPAEAYQAAPIQERYNALSEEDKAKVTNKSLLDSVMKYYTYYVANIYGSTDGKGTFERVDGTTVGKAFKITITQSYSLYNFRINIGEAKPESLFADEYKDNDTFVLYTFGLPFTDGEDDALCLKNHGGGTIVVAKFTHTNLANGWVKHSMTAGRAKNLAAYVDGRSETQNYVRYYFSSIAAGTFYVSNMFGVHA